MSARRSAPHYPTPRGYAVAAGEAVPGSGHDVKASGQSTGGNLTVIEIAIDGGPPRHTHTHEDESLYLFTGVLDIECGDDRFYVESGGFVFLPRLVPHAFVSVDGPATGLLVVTPGGLDEYFAELHAALNANAEPSEIQSIQDDYGIVVA
jgi:mannose-6-phosphate isomerase-like protein (cupin superfamily)